MVDITDAEEHVDKAPDISSTLKQGLTSDEAASMLVSAIRKEHGTTARGLFKKLNDLEPDAVVQAGGVQAVFDALGTTGMSDAEHKACFEQGCVLLMSVSGSALDGSRACRDALVDGKAAAVVIDGLRRHKDDAALELGEAGAAALMQLACVDLPTALAGGLADAIVKLMETPGSGGWLLFLCARTLSWCACVQGADAADAHSMLRKAGAVKALLLALRRERVLDPSCGEPFGVPDVLDQLNVEARKALSRLVSASSEDGYALSCRHTDVALYVLRDRVVVHSLKAKPELNGAAGIVTEVGEPGCGPDSAIGRYGVRIALPANVRGTGLKLKPANLRLAPREVALKIGEVDGDQARPSGSSPLPDHLDTKFGRLNVSVVEPGV